MDRNRRLSAMDSGDQLRNNKGERRKLLILERLQQHGEIFVEELSRDLNISVVTLRRDLDTLAEQGLLSRTHGGAVSIQPLFYEPFKDDRNFRAQLSHEAEAKKRIGRAAAAMIHLGETIAVSPGTTTAQVIRSLPLGMKITVVTNTANFAMELSKRKDVGVFVTGGQLHGDWFSLVGPSALQSLEAATIHTVFIGADGAHAEAGLSSFSQYEADVIHAMIRRAQRRIAIVDHTKLGVTINWRICDCNVLDTLITDVAATEEQLQPFHSIGVEIVTV